MNATASMSRYDNEGRILDRAALADAMNSRSLPDCEDGGVWFAVESIDFCDACNAESVPGVSCGPLSLCQACADAEIKRAATAEPCLCTICNGGDK